MVKLNIAQKQLREEEEKRRVAIDSTGSRGEPSTEGGTVYPVSGDGREPSIATNGSSAETPKNKRFYMSAELDTTRINRDVQKLVEEVISHLMSVDGCRVEISLEVNANSPEGFSPQIIRTISENCRTLKVNDFGFE